MSDSEDRSQDPSKQRRELAREAGIVAHSPELTASIGMFAAGGLLALFGPAIFQNMIDLIRVPFLNVSTVSESLFDGLNMFRSQVLGLFLQLSVILFGSIASMFLVHMIQIGGSWIPGRVTPDISRLGIGWQAATTGFGTRAGRGLWGISKAVLVSLVAAWMISRRWQEFQVLGLVHHQELARLSSSAISSIFSRLALALAILGVIDFSLQYRRIEARLKITVEEFREELRANDGDPALRSRRRKIAQSWRVDPAEVLVGAALVVTGRDGLTLVLGGGPPPRPITFRATANGAAGRRLRLAAEMAGLPRHDAADLAKSLSVRRSPGQPIPLEISRELSDAWPVKITSN